MALGVRWCCGGGEVMSFPGNDDMKCGDGGWIRFEGLCLEWWAIFFWEWRLFGGSGVGW